MVSWWSWPINPLHGHAPQHHGGAARVRRGMPTMAVAPRCPEQVERYCAGPTLDDHLGTTPGTRTTRVGDTVREPLERHPLGQALDGLPPFAVERNLVAGHVAGHHKVPLPASIAGHPQFATRPHILRAVKAPVAYLAIPHVAVPALVAKNAGGHVHSDVPAGWWLGRF